MPRPGAQASTSSRLPGLTVMTDIDEARRREPIFDLAHCGSTGYAPTPQREVGGEIGRQTVRC